MAEDSRVPEIQAYHHRVSGLQGEGDGIGSWCSCGDLDCKVLYLLDALDALEQPAPRVFFPGDTVPAGMWVAPFGEPAPFAQGDAWTVHQYDSPVVEIHVPTRDEWQAVVDRAKVARGLA